MIHLETPRLDLVKFRRSDLDGLIELDTDPEVMRFLTGAPRARADIERSLASIIDDYDKTPGFGVFAAFEKPNQEFVGWFAFKPDRVFDGAYELGYRLRRSAWGRGLATEGSLALIRKGVEEQDVTWVTGRCMKANEASANVLRKCGLTLVEEYVDPRYPGDHLDLLFERRFLPSTLQPAS